MFADVICSLGSFNPKACVVQFILVACLDKVVK